MKLKKAVLCTAFFIGLETNKTTCYAGEFPDSFSFKNKKPPVI